jgi:hypothetical protein
MSSTRRGNCRVCLSASSRMTCNGKRREGARLIRNAVVCTERAAVSTVPELNGHVSNELFGLESTAENGPAARMVSLDRQVVLKK